MTGWTVEELNALLTPAAGTEQKGPLRQRPDSARRSTSAPDDLPRALRRLLAATVPDGGVSSRFMSLVLLCIELGLPPDVTDSVLRSHEPSVRKYGARLEGRIDALLQKHPHARSDCVSAQCLHAPPGGGSSQDAVRQTVRAMRASAQQYPWPPRRRLTVLAVLNAHLNMAEKVGALEYDFDRRRMSVAAGVARATTDKRVRELLEAGWLALAEGDGVPTHSLTYRLLGAPVGPHNPHPFSAGEPTASQLCGPTSEDADVWRNGIGLGKSRRQTWIALTEGARTVDLLIKVTGLTQRTIRLHLVRFNQLGMAGPITADPWRGEWEPYDVDWEQLALHLGVAGHRERQVQRYQRESEAHRHYVQSGGGAWSPSEEPTHR